MLHRLLSRFPSFLTPVVALCLVSGCDAGTTAPPGEDVVEPPDTALEDTSPPPNDTFTAADLDLGLPDSNIGDRELRNGSIVWVGHVTDGDTVTVWLGDLAPARYTIRLVGLAAPECFKEMRSTPDGTGSSCSSDDEIHGLASFVALRDLVEDKRVTITCQVAPGAICPKDAFGRSLAYLGFDGKDAAVEMARGGHALSYVTFYADKRAEICAGVYDARKKKVGMWALGTETYVISRMNADTRSWYTALHDKRCDEALGL